VLRAMGSVKGSAGERPNLEGVLVATDAVEVARDAVELLRGGGTSLSGPPLEYQIYTKPHGGCQTVGVNLVPKGEAPTPQYSSPPKGQRTKEPLRRTTPSSTTANSTTTATTKRRLEKTATTYYFGVLHHLILVSPITMALLYIGMGVDGDFPPSP
jgi:hypothetical protein